MRKVNRESFAASEGMVECGVHATFEEFMHENFQTKITIHRFKKPYEY